MKLYSWNVNGLRACMNKGCADFLAAADPDVICLQETKMQREQATFDFPGYEEYWKKKEEVYKMRYMRDDYGDDYGRRGRDSRGRYMGGGRSHEGEEMIEEIREHYGNYMEGGRYNGPEKEKAFDYMLKSAEDFFCYLMEEVENHEQMEKIKRTARRISEIR